MPRSRDRDTDSSSSRRPTRRRGPISAIVRGIAAGIGLASESYHHHQEKKMVVDAVPELDLNVTTDGDGSPCHLAETAQQQPGYNVRGGYDDNKMHAAESDDDNRAEEETIELDSAAWVLDDAQFELVPPPDYDVATQQGDADVTSQFLTDHCVTDKQPAQQHYLAAPIIIPQRRPGERARGFVRAYSPMLEAVGISQRTFLGFITSLNEAAMPSPWINAINVASLAVQHVPEPVTIAVSIAAHYATQATLQVHSRTKTNAFISKLNEEFFRPKGLIAVILTWKPSRPGEVFTQARFDGTIEQAAQRASDPRDGAAGKLSNRMQASHGTTNFEWPESAPLVFPELEALASTKEGQDKLESEGKKLNAVQGSIIFAMKYMDKRGQAKWAADHPESGLANIGPKVGFHSRYADPNHPASSGSPLALLTGGYIQGRRGQRRQSRRDRRDERRDLRDQRREERGPTLLNTVGPLALIRGVKQFMNEDVLYLMIANLPSVAQMDRASQFMATQQAA